ncbi:MAG TPA: hypothetical protein VK654_00060 [Nitrospirota bacterium]|nr:hypothetical protein [Nitrospirota bacterium]
MRSTILAVMTAALVSAAPAVSHGRAPLPGEVTIEIVSDHGQQYHRFSFLDFWKNGTHVIKNYLEAKKGENYGIVVRNNTSERVGVVIAVDGRNIITGKRSDCKSSEMMYIVNPYDTARYDGWRTTDSEVHRFYFTEPGDSYSVRTFADASAMGVIAAAVFREREKPRPLLERGAAKEAPAAAPPASAGDAARPEAKARADESAGTGFGDSRYSPVVRVEFEPELIAIQKNLIKYEWRETLCRKGIVRCGGEQKNRLWEDDEYAPYPPGYPRS